MSSIWAPVVAALGASILTAVASLGVTWYREHLHGIVARRTRRRDAYTALYNASMAAALRASTLDLTIRVRSGVGESVDVLLGKRKMLDPLELHDWLMQDWAPVHEAAGHVMLLGSPAAAELSRQIVLQCATLVQHATSLPPTAGALPRLRQVRRDADWLAKWNEEVERLGELRKQFASLARSEEGELPLGERQVPTS
ncbi:MAG: hypothetical protein ACYCZN_09650 [Candidatus Dormibacteria bacterium]